MIEIKWHREAVKELKRLPNDVTKATLNKIRGLAKNPNLGIKLKGYKLPFRRLRVGNVRVIYFHDVEKQEIKIYRIGFRGDIYKDMP